MYRVPTIVLVIVLTLLLILSNGCSLIQSHSEDKLKDANMTLQIAKNCVPLAQEKVGFIQGIWFGRMNELPGQIQDIMDEYMRASVDPNSFSYEQAGYVIGLEMRMDEIVFRKFLGDHFPELLRYMP